MVVANPETNNPTRTRLRRIDPYWDRNHNAANTNGSTAPISALVKDRPTIPNVSTTSITTVARRVRYPDVQDTPSTTLLTAAMTHSTPRLLPRDRGAVRTRDTTTKTANNHRVLSTMPTGGRAHPGSRAANLDLRVRMGPACSPSTVPRTPVVRLPDTTTTTTLLVRRPG
ncbi:hypothetical protein [Cellulomonas sp. P24]|uniref:hypothetical protein n=1 Tax=Cellulomonas sp. P24 TaxID=2885206 RepID=UPI00216AEFCD|nr:hypothetical protein [Cellulomonas sp. P24]MCR6492030.1 hypothetical protein [Cellulomonas sp. P24]